MKTNKAHFLGNVVTEWLPNGREMILQEEFSFVDSEKNIWTAPKLSIIDGASIPRLFWYWVGSPYVGKYRRATVLHDVHCNQRSRPFKQVHKMFYEAMICDNTPEIKAKAIYEAVKQFGPKWNDKGEIIEPTEEQKCLMEMEKVGL